MGYCVPIFAIASQPTFLFNKSFGAPTGCLLNGAYYLKASI